MADRIGGSVSYSSQFETCSKHKPITKAVGWRDIEKPRRSSVRTVKKPKHVCLAAEYNGGGSPLF
jgi:hypothetical protein